MCLLYVCVFWYVSVHMGRGVTSTPLCWTRPRHTRVNRLNALEMCLLLAPVSSAYHKPRSSFSKIITVLHGWSLRTTESLKGLFFNHTPQNLYNKCQRIIHYLHSMVWIRLHSNSRSQKKKKTITYYCFEVKKEISRQLQIKIWGQRCNINFFLPPL